MAKAKKTSAASASAPASETAGSKPAAKGVKKKAAKASDTAQVSAPMIDTNLAAAMAAKRIAHRDQLSPAANPSSGESAAFKEMKENLHKPVGQGTPSFLRSPLVGKKFNNAVPGKHQQLGRNQTFGADVNRTGVPRRTGG